MLYDFNLITYMLYLCNPTIQLDLLIDKDTISLTIYDRVRKGEISTKLQGFNKIGTFAPAANR